MATFVMVATLTPEGVRTLKSNPERIREVNREVEQLGITVREQWATLGEFDFVSIVEAPDERAMARLGNDGLHWPRRDGLKWPHLASVVVGVDVD